MKKKRLYLVCNAHLDPVWLWQWEEGLAETLSTYRTAAEFCEEFDGFIFNHNEAVLYKWVEIYEPELFEKIQLLVANGKWHPMGGWYLQPDCNLPSGESFVRQILVGKNYFIEKFGVEPTAAVNLDPFGHTRGLVQILAKSGYDSYLICRPDEKHLHLPGDDFVWVGYDGSEITVHRAAEHYNSERGKAGEKIRGWLNKNNDLSTGLLLWGIGNHGGGPSREDLTRLDQIIAEEDEWEILHARPEDYFKNLEENGSELERFSGDLNPWAVGCYTTMARVKQKHRQLENLYFSTEKMLTNASIQGLMEYPRKALDQALEDMLFCEFHDILPGSSISEVEEYALQRMDHGLEIVSRLRARAFFALLSGQPRAEDGEFPLFVYNPHPYDVEETVICEFQPPEPNFNRDKFLLPELTDADGNVIPYQLEKESSNISVDQRKRIVFVAKLPAADMSRFNCRLREVERIAEDLDTKQESLSFETDYLEVLVNKSTGLLDRFRTGDVDYLTSEAFKPLVIEDYPDPWGMKVRGFRNVVGAFELMSAEESAEFAGVSLPRLEPVRVIEDGPVRTVIEALFSYGHSALCVRYKVPKAGTEIEVEVRVCWMEKDRMLKLSIPTAFADGQCIGQVAYGVEKYQRTGEENVAQKWLGILSADNKNALTVINNGTYGFDCERGEIRLSLLRSAAHSGHPVADDIPIVRQDRFEARIDQGERIFRFWINAGPAEERLAVMDREALAKNEAPFAFCARPSGKGTRPLPGIGLSDRTIQLNALKMAEKHNWLILRLFEPTGEDRRTRATMPALDLEFDVSLGAFEIKSFGVDLESKSVFEVDLLERKLD